ncbi:nuclear transport factor 2 family protein [Curtobacterium flaccumfaciens pv. flaccumfaciens]|uniref:YybH family protein n=1 Tax=Curtobacterium flaccumfaciens TaxID=2035 RepID=UPI0021B13BAC|nr:nuclear transport factor 2 family protein [Curtobacterium flaccumfaciens]QYI96238.1 nuclear transport factor 2 family protein [Curtobacterium flaccumfaciens pv. flaccumfaciens]
MPGTAQNPTLERDTINKWIAATNTHDTAVYLDFFSSDGVLDDPSVGHIYNGPSEIADYFESYFIGYNTQTRLVSIEPHAGYLHVTVDFTGDFPGGQTGGIFDITLDEDQKFQRVRADLT